MTRPKSVAEALTAPSLSMTGLAHGFFSRRGGVSQGVYSSLNCGIGSGDDREAVLVNRARALGALGLDSGLIASPFQVHGGDVAIVTEAWPPGEEREADAVVTNVPSLAVGIATADCAPVLFADTEAGVVGAAHAGWGGVLKGVLEATVTAMATLGARPERVRAAIGPAIAQESYEVGLELRERFLDDAPDNDRFFAASVRPDYFQFDLVGLVQARLHPFQLAAVSTIALDTYASEERCFSYRRTTHRGETDYGRAISAIALV